MRKRDLAKKRHRRQQERLKAKATGAEPIAVLYPPEVQAVDVQYGIISRKLVRTVWTKVVLFARFSAALW